ncbi:hypothetical protein WA026_005272 [Henosepilachna vigintioctopunctata]|uniref:Uncharacterized protein n=1 Tax=Henosepilachna vigintioctopunctata TaxID=420089 RepID=A0AAW1ULF7_9CUCU
MFKLHEKHLEVRNKCNSCTEVKSPNETKENTAQTESFKSIRVIEEGTNMDSNDPSCKIEAAKIKFDAEISTSTENLDAFQNTIPVSSLLEYAQRYRPDVLPPTLGPCSCLGRAKYNCGCYEAIKRSVDEDEELIGIMLKDNKLQPDEIITDEVHSSIL